MKEQNPFRVHSMRSFNPYVGSFHSPTWGYQRHNSYRVVMLHSAFIMQYSANRKTIFRLFIPHVGSFYSPTWSFQRHDSYRVAMLVRVILRRKVVQVILRINRDCKIIGYKLFYGLSVIMRWQWLLWRAMRCFSCSYCVAIMCSKALHYTMMVDIVSLLEGGEYNQLGTSCAFESPWLARNEPTSGER